MCWESGCVLRCVPSHKRELHLFPPLCWTDVLGFVTGVRRRVQETCRQNGQNGYGRKFNDRSFRLCPFFVTTEVCTEEQGHAGSTEMGVVIQVGSGYGYLFFTYIRLYR